MSYLLAMSSLVYDVFETKDASISKLIYHVSIVNDLFLESHGLICHWIGRINEDYGQSYREKQVQFDIDFTEAYEATYLRY